jgi:hypothetical protein
VCGDPGLRWTLSKALSCQDNYMQVTLLEQALHLLELECACSGQERDELIEQPADSFQ